MSKPPLRIANFFVILCLLADSIPATSAHLFLSQDKRGSSEATTLADKGCFQNQAVTAYLVGGFHEKFNHLAAYVARLFPRFQLAPAGGDLDNLGDGKRDSNKFPGWASYRPPKSVKDRMWSMLFSESNGEIPGDSGNESPVNAVGPVMFTGSGTPDIGTYSLFWALHVLNGKDIDGRTPREYDRRTRINALANLFIRIRTAGITPVDEVLGLDAMEQIVSEWESKWFPDIQHLESALEQPGAIEALIEQFHQANVHYLSEMDPSKLYGRRILVRMDFNDIHVGARDEEIDDIRLNAGRETLEFLQRHGARIIVATHSGRPSGQGIDPRFPVTHVGEAVGRLLGLSDVPVVMGREISPGHYAVVTDEVVKRAKELQPGGVMVLNNLRFDWRERSPNPSEQEGLAADLSAVADLFVLDGFPISHRPNASVIEMHKVLPSVAGFWQEREMRAHQEFRQVMEDPSRAPMAAIFGGSKPDKWPLIQGFVSHFREGDKVLVGGQIADYISRHHQSEIDLWEKRGLEVVLASDSLDGRDIGPETMRAFREQLQGVSIVYWNGPVGEFETSPYHSGSYALAQDLKEGLGNGHFSHVFVSGGETAFVVKSALGLTEKSRHGIPGLYISTGGGTSTDFFAFGRNIGMQSLWGISAWYRHPSGLITDLSPFLIRIIRPLRGILYGLVLFGVPFLASTFDDRFLRLPSERFFAVQIASLRVHLLSAA